MGQEDELRHSVTGELEHQVQQALSSSSRQAFKEVFWNLSQFLHCGTTANSS